MNDIILEQVGLSHYDSIDFFPRKIKLRKGKETILWVHQPSGHGVLDSENWPTEAYYEEEYREEFSANSDGRKIETDKHFEIFKKINKKQFEVFSGLINPETKFLEIGPSHGGIIEHVSKSSVKCYHAVEPNKEDAFYLKKKYPELKIYNSLLEKIELTEDYYDTVVSFEVLEHTLSPVKFLNILNRSMNNKANLVLEVPNHDDVLLSCYNEDITYKDFYYHKAHIHYFTKTSLKEMCEQCGFTGNVTSFLMYPFFNHVYWVQNSGPQATAALALSLPKSTSLSTNIQKKINNFYQDVEEQYEQLINSNGVGDCLIFKGIKNG